MNIFLGLFSLFAFAFSFLYLESSFPIGSPIIAYCAGFVGGIAAWDCWTKHLDRMFLDRD